MQNEKALGIIGARDAVKAAHLLLWAGDVATAGQAAWGAESGAGSELT